MRVLIISKDGGGSSIAYKLAMEGHHVDFWIEEPGKEYALKGYVSRPKAWRPCVSQADLVLCDMVGYSKYADIFKRLGKPLIGANPIADVLELDRQRGMEAFHKLGINTPPSQEFKSIEEAAKLKWANDAGYVVKGSGNLDVGKTYLCPTEEIYQWALTTMKGATDILVQELIPKEDSVEVSTEGWFNGVDWIHPFNHTFEEKHYMPGNYTKMVGCAGNVVVPLEKPSKLVLATVARFKPILMKAGYRGPIDVNCIVTKDKIYALELTCRFGYDAFEAVMTGLNEPVGAVLFDIATGIKKTIDMRKDFLIAVRVSRDPYPYASPEDIKEPDRGMPICGLNETDLRFTYLSDVYRDDGDKQIKYAATDGVIAVATAFGRSIKEAQHRVYKVCNNIKAIDIAYRTDIGDRVDKELGLLREWGWV